MKHDEDIIIELSTKVVNYAINTDDRPYIDFEHLPFKSFTFFYQLKSNEALANQVGEDIIEHTVKELLKSSNKSLSQDSIDKIKKSFKDTYVYTTVFINEKGIFLEVQDGDDRMTIVKCRVLFKDLKPKITFIKQFDLSREYVNIEASAMGIALDNYKIALILLAYLQEPNQVVESDKKKREPNLHSTTKSVAQKTQGKRTNYLSKKVYRIDDLATKRTATGREFTRHTESWNVCGHWRTYKSGKRTWIEQSVRGDRTKKAKPKQVKLANIEDSNKDE